MADSLSEEVHDNTAQSLADALEPNAMNDEEADLHIEEASLPSEAEKNAPQKVLESEADLLSNDVEDHPADESALADALLQDEATSSPADRSVIVTSPTFQADLATPKRADNDDNDDNDTDDNEDGPSAAALLAQDAIHAVTDGVRNAVNTFHPDTSQLKETDEDSSVDNVAPRTELTDAIRAFSTCMTFQQLESCGKAVKQRVEWQPSETEVLRKAYEHRKRQIGKGQATDTVPWDENYQMVVTPEIPPPPEPKLHEIWAAMFHPDDYMAILRNQAVATVLRSRPFRSVSWRLFLGALPEDRSAWRTSLATSRERYTALRKQLTVDPRTGESDTNDHPLSTEDEAKWHQYFADMELRDVIMRDVTRTFPEEPYFESESVRAMMAELLFVYSKLNPDVSYRQGMHELLAALMLVIAKEAEMVASNADMQAKAVPADVKSEMCLVLDQDFIEHDTYTLFACLMQDMKPFFLSDTYQRPEGKTGGKQAKFGFDPFAAMFEDKKAEDDKRDIADQAVDNNELSPLQRKLNWIQYSLLGRAEPELLRKLRQLDIPPQIYGLRWVRLLLSREFSLPETLIIWDALFAEGESLVLIDYLCVALLVYIKDYVLSHDYTECLVLLMRFPSVPDVQALVQKALHLRNSARFPDPPDWRFDPDGGRSAPARTDEAAGIMGVFSQAAHRAQEFVGSYVPALAPYNADNSATSPRRPIGRQASTAADMMQEEYNSLRECNMRLGEKLEHAIETIQSQLRRSTSTSLKVLDRATVQLALYELHQVQDVLAGRLPPDLLGFPRTADDGELRMVAPDVQPAIVHTIRDTTVPLPKPAAATSEPTAMAQAASGQRASAPRQAAGRGRGRGQPQPSRGNAGHGRARSRGRGRRQQQQAPTVQEMAVLHAEKQPEMVFVPDDEVVHLADEDGSVPVTEKAAELKNRLAMARLPEKSKDTVERDE
eukprot:TRINITY_DN11620_c0_g1_i1.p1 TRINITY_DN11620_c0_g1~~TRINITY_DN11620_c0_g1_i1.p1  ORF type:complete len:946 (+),score=238.42 TRINITY_DN11620_c0_g1_i1:133-2970(+)